MCVVTERYVEVQIYSCGKAVMPEIDQKRRGVGSVVPSLIGVNAPLPGE